MKIYHLFKYTLLIFFFVSSSFIAQSLQLKIFETTDSHGKIFPYDFKNDRKSNNSLAQFYTYIKQERKDSNQSFLLFSNGDILQGTPAVYYYNFEKTDVNHLYARVMNYMGYDLGTVGNHDIETGHSVYDRFKTQINFPWLAANALNTETKEPYFQPYQMFYKNGVRIAVLGLITPGIPNWLPEKIWSGIEFTDMIESAKKWIPIIKQREKPDVIIGLFHSGVEYNYGGLTADTPLNENASQLVAERVPGFDVVFVGHDHHGWNKFVENVKGDSVLIIGGTSYGKIGAEISISLNFDKSTSSWSKSIKGELINSKNFAPDSNFTDKFSHEFEEVKSYVNKKIGSFTESINTRESLFNDSKFMDLIHTIQLELTDADISFASPLSFNTEITKGDIFVRDMFKLYSYENLLYTMKLSGKEIKDILEYSASKWFNTMKDKNDHIFNFIKDENGNLKYSKRSKSPTMKERYYNFESAAGIDYEIDVSKPIGSKVKVLQMSNGKKFDQKKIYKVAMNSYRGNGGGGHLTFGAKIPKQEISNRIISSTEKDLRYYLMKWIEKKGIVNPKTDTNWKVVPEEWFTNAKEKDSLLIFSK